MEDYDKTDPRSIFQYSTHLLNHTLREAVGDDALVDFRGKGKLGQMVELLYFKYPVNNYPGPDFREAGVELKCTPLKKLVNKQLQNKERLVVDMINYMEVVKVEFKESLFYKKCKLMLILFYLHVSGLKVWDLDFIYSVLWRLPEEDLEIIEHDYWTIINKIKAGKAHELSEGDTMYLGACRKGQKGETPSKQPFSDVPAPRRAFCFKVQYMHTILRFVQQSGEQAVTNTEYTLTPLFDAEQLKKKSFDDIVLEKFQPYYGKDYLQISNMLGLEISKAKSKYFLISNRIVTDKIGNVNQSEEFTKAGLTMKTIRVQSNGNLKESMSFENIDFNEVWDNDDWLESRLFELFSSRFLFVVYREVPDVTIDIQGKKEGRYILDKAFFWTMPNSDLDDAEKYWLNIRENIKNCTTHVGSNHFWTIKDHKKFHVRPKAVKGSFKDATTTPFEKTDKQCYWFNSEYVKQIVDSQH